MFFGTVTAVLDWDFGKLIFKNQFLKGDTYVLYKLILDIAGLLCLVGLGMAFYRRFIKGGQQYERSKRFLYILGSLAIIIITGFLVEALRIAASDTPIAAWSPVANFIAKTFYSGMSTESLISQHTFMWTFHMIISLIFVAMIPATYFAHMYKSPSSIYWKDMSAKGGLPRIRDIEEQEEFGVSRFNQFTWHDRLNFDACTECGRCTAVCPVNRAGGVLDPRALILSLKKTMHGDYKAIEEPLINNVISSEALLSCTTCGACVEQCPSKIAIVSAIVRMRRSVAMEEGHFAPGVAKTLQNITSVGNPWGLDPDSRLDWTKGLDVPVAEPDKQYDILYWVGCMASYDKRSQKIAKAMVKILKASGLRFAVMKEESCDAELARRVGEEYLFECQTLMNIENLRQYKFTRILCTCPHCFNTIKNDYPEFEGGTFNVISHVQFIAEQMQAGRLKAASIEPEAFTIQDACYLARWNNIVEEPRIALEKIKNFTLINPLEWGENTTCCGAGGGQFWTDQDAGKRLNVIRLKQIVNTTGKKNVAISCPFCLAMFDSAKAEEKRLSEVEVADIAEIIASRLNEPAKQITPNN
ncbi:MAG: (Fe-S)-binding protein [Burkholderiales bacterium]|nr:(Fe-S)-binding protein [Burkholderiales bacterium]